MVVDASAIVKALGIEHPDVALEERLIAAGDLHAPHLVDLEVANALRGLERGGRISPHGAFRALARFFDLEIIRYPHVDFLKRIWTLTGQLTSYDAAYVALAEVLDMPLVTTDARLARSSGHSATIELV